MTNTENHPTMIIGPTFGVMSTTKTYFATCTERPTACGWYGPYRDTRYEAEADAEAHDTGKRQRDNLTAFLTMLETMMPTRRADFQASVIAGAADAIDTATWATILTNAAQHAHRDPWA